MQNVVKFFFIITLKRDRKHQTFKNLQAILFYLYIFVGEFCKFLLIIKIVQQIFFILPIDD